MIISVVAVHAIALPLVCLGTDMSEHVVKLHKLRVWLWFSKMRFCTDKINLRKVISILPVRLKYGRFWYIRGDFRGKYVWMIILRCFDAILIIDFQ